MEYNHFRTTILYYPKSCAEFQWHFDYVMTLMPVPHRLHDLELPVPVNGMQWQCDTTWWRNIFDSTRLTQHAYPGYHILVSLGSTNTSIATGKSMIQEFRTKFNPKLQCRTPWIKAPIAGSCPVSPRCAKWMSINLVNLCTALPPPHPSKHEPHKANATSSVKNH